MFTHVSAQNESPLQPFFNHVILNPAFAGLDRQTTFQTGNQFADVDSATAYNLFFATYDTYSDKLKGGIAYYFQQCLIGEKNISTTEIGFAYAGFPQKMKNGTIRFGVNTNVLLATKQWLVYAMDRFMISEMNPPNPPGEELLRYVIIKPRLSFLWEISSVTWGISIGSALKTNFTSSTESEEKKIPVNASFYLSKNRDRFHKGVHSKPFAFNPELVFYYQPEYIFSRINLYAEYTAYSLGLFLQSAILNDQYTVGGIGGLAYENLRINLCAGCGIPKRSSHIGFTSEISLILSIPQFDYTKINPWEPQ